VIEANRLSVPGERAALERVEAVVAAIDATRVEMLAPSRATLVDPDERADLVQALEADADRCGRRELLDDVRERVRDAIHRRLTRPLRGDASGIQGQVVFPTRAEDAALIELTLVDAVAVAVMEDRLDAETAARLAAPGRLLLGLPALGGAGPRRLPPSLPEPTADDWAEAASGDTRVGGYSPIPVTARIVVATVIACTAGPAAMFAGVAGGSTLVGIAAGLAVVALCWLFATYHR
jgi:hypothetical protein